MSSDSKIIVALDYANANDVFNVVEQLSPELCRLKVGKELFTYCGSALVKQLIAMGFDIFLDLKFHDIPSTVAKACIAAADMGVWMVNVHALGGTEMMQAARDAVDSCKNKPLLIAVTILTSMQQDNLTELGINVSIDQQVINLATLAKASGLDGVVCSAFEARQLKQTVGNNFCLVTPGIRPAGICSDDQKRVMTPTEAIDAGSDYLVIGRAITNAANPLQALISINELIS